MQIPLRKIHESPGKFHLKEGGIECFGTFHRSGRHKVTIEGRLEGEADFVCDRCGKNFGSPVKESFLLEVVYKITLARPVKDKDGTWRMPHRMNKFTGEYKA